MKTKPIERKVPFLVAKSIDQLAGPMKTIYVAREIESPGRILYAGWDKNHLKELAALDPQADSRLFEVMPINVEEARKSALKGLTGVERLVLGLHPKEGELC